MSIIEALRAIVAWARSIRGGVVIVAPKVDTSSPQRRGVMVFGSNVEHMNQVGLSAERDQGYNRGPSSWMHTHCLHYADGKRTLVSVIRGRFRAEPARMAS